jgi:phospholipid/cholesterol/gamma-HCH transport system substrate-binding protein
MKETSRNLTVGLTTLLGVVGLMILLLLFGYVPAFLQEGYTITVEFDDAAGLNPGSRVELAGIDIGSVESVMFKQPYGSGVESKLRIRDEIQIPANARAVIKAPLLGGSPKVKFSVDRINPDAEMAFLSQDGTEVVKGSAGDLSGAFSELEKLTQQLSQLSTDWRAVARNIVDLTEPRDLEKVEAGEIKGNLSTLLSRLDLRVEEFRGVLHGADQLINDPTMREDLRQTAANARQASGDVADTVTTLKTRYVAVADDLSKAVIQLNTLLEKGGGNEGTLGKLLNDPALYDNLDGTATRIGQAIDELRLLLQKWKAEGVPINL